MGSIAVAIIAACAVIAGGIITGLFALAVQRGARKSEEERWSREADERARTRFHEMRLQVYTEFVEWATKVLGFKLQGIMYEFHRSGQISDPVPPELVKAVESGDSFFDKDALWHMLQCFYRIMMVANSQEVKDAAYNVEIASKTLSVAGKKVETEGGQKVYDAYIGFNAAVVQFIFAAHAELAS